MPFLGRLGIAGFAKEGAVPGVAVVPPTVFLPFLPPESFTPAIALLESKGVFTHADVVHRTAQGAGEIKGAKIKTELNPDTIGHMLMAAFGADTVTEVASYVVTLATNDKIDFTEDGGAPVAATLTPGTYKMGTSSSQAGTLCALIKSAMEAVNGASTYTVTYSYTTKKLTITKSAGVFVINWATGANTATAAKTLLGFSNADTASAIAATSDSTTQPAVQSHVFKRADVSQLPTYTYWFKKADKYPYFSGCMLSKLSVEAKAKEYITADAEFVGLKYEGYDAAGAGVSPSYSTRVPFTFANAVLKMDTVASLDYDTLKFDLDNMVEAEHVVATDIWAKKVWAGGFRATLAANLIFEDDVQYQKFLSSADAKVELILTHGDSINTAGTKYALTFTVPVAKYLTAPFVLPDGRISVPFTAVAKYNVADSASIIATLVTDVAVAY